jgi:hypothetical protein
LSRPSSTLLPCTSDPEREELLYAYNAANERQTGACIHARVGNFTIEIEVALDYEEDGRIPFVRMNVASSISAIYPVRALLMFDSNPVYATH